MGAGSPRIHVFFPFCARSVEDQLYFALHFTSRRSSGFTALWSQPLRGEMTRTLSKSIFRSEGTHAGSNVGGSDGFPDFSLQQHHLNVHDGHLENFQTQSTSQACG